METQKIEPDTLGAGPVNGHAPRAVKPVRTAAEIEDWLVTYLADELKTSPEELDVTAPFDRFGLSSATAVFMIGNLEEWLGREVDPTLPYDYPTIQALAGRLASSDDKVTR
jgi:acyl carrier protein